MNGQAGPKIRRTATDGEVPNPSWPLPLPESVFVRGLLPAADPDTRAAFRLTCRVLRTVVDASMSNITLSGSSPEKLVSFAAALPRLPGLRHMELTEATDGSIAAFAALALPQLTQITSLSMYMEGEEDEEHAPEEEDILAPASAAPVAPYGGLMLGQHLGNLQRLKIFIGPARRHAWGVLAGERIDNALASLPALARLDLCCDISAEVLFQPRALQGGAVAWRSLKELIGRGWTTEGVETLARAPLRHLDDLCLYAPICKPGDESLCAIISGAPWAKQLEGLLIESIPKGMPIGMLSNLRLPNLCYLNLFGDDDLPEQSPTHLPVEAMEPPEAT